MGKGKEWKNWPYKTNKEILWFEMIFSVETPYHYKSDISYEKKIRKKKKIELKVEKR